MKKLTHLDAANRPTMVDVGAKQATFREAMAEAVVKLPPIVARELKRKGHRTKKGPVFDTAIVAGVMAAKKTHEIVPSTGSVGDAYDNTMAESFFGTLEAELLARRRFRTHEEARVAIFDYVENWYNPRRLHSSLGYVSPVEFERRAEESAKEACLAAV